MFDQVFYVRRPSEKALDTECEVIGNEYRMQHRILWSRRPIARLVGRTSEQRGLDYWFRQRR